MSAGAKKTNRCSLDPRTFHETIKREKFNWLQITHCFPKMFKSFNKSVCTLWLTQSWSGHMKASGSSQIDHGWCQLVSAGVGRLAKANLHRCCQKKSGCAVCSIMWGTFKMSKFIPIDIMQYSQSCREIITVNKHTKGDILVNLWAAAGFSMTWWRLSENAEAPQKSTAVCSGIFWVMTYWSQSKAQF